MQTSKRLDKTNAPTLVAQACAKVSELDLPNLRGEHIRFLSIRHPAFSEL
jgi:hypothetical protein